MTRQLAALIAAMLIVHAGGCGDDTPPADQATSSTTTTLAVDHSRVATTAPPATDSPATEPVVADEDAYVNAVLASGGNFADLVAAVGESGVRCYLGAAVRAFGVDALNAAGVTPEAFAAGAPEQLPVSIPDANLPRLRSDVQACFDPVDFIVRTFAASAELTPDQQHCVRSELTADLALSAVVDIVRGPAAQTPDSALTQVFNLINGCAPPPPDG